MDPHGGFLKNGYPGILPNQSKSSISNHFDIGFSNMLHYQQTLWGIPILGNLKAHFRGSNMFATPAWTCSNGRREETDTRSIQTTNHTTPKQVSQPRLTRSCLANTGLDLHMIHIFFLTWLPWLNKHEVSSRSHVVFWDVTWGY